PPASNVFPIIPNIPGRVKIPPPACQLTLSLGGPSFNQFRGFAEPLTLNLGILILGNFQLKLKNPFICSIAVRTLSFARLIGFMMPSLMLFHAVVVFVLS